MSMAALIAVAESAQDVASGLNKFLDGVPESATEITGLIAECFAISSALRELSTAIGDYRFNRRYELIAEDVRTVRLSLDYTFEDVVKLFGGLGRSTYRQVWRDLELHFQTESRNPLSTRLHYYRNFLMGLARIIADIPLDHAEYENLQYKIEALLDVQQGGLIDDVNNLSLGDPYIARPKSFERRRPPHNRLPSPTSPPLGGTGMRHGLQSPLSPGFDRDYFDYPPAAPEVPISPTTTNTFSSQSSSSASSSDHWVPRLFLQSRSTTGFETLGQVSACFGVDMPDASVRLAADHAKILELPFEEGDLLVRLYLRHTDHRARMHCRSMRPNKSRKQSCLSLTSLSVKRDASNLVFTRISQSGKMVERWASLRFTSYEKLVLFFCTFLALRSQDNGPYPVHRITDDQLRGEKLLFSGIIIDDGFQHALAMFKDRDSGGIRLQASVMKKELKRTPVWTAFITHQVASRIWMRKPDSRTIHLTELQRFIFMTDYSPQLGPGGEHELHFDESDGAKGFIRAIDDLRRR